MLQTRRPALSGNALKGIAILAMTLDHLTWTLWPGYATDWWVLVCHLLGRVTAPIMWFFIAEGYHYTHDVKKYAVRLFALAFISHFTYEFMGQARGDFRKQMGWLMVWSAVYALVYFFFIDKVYALVQLGTALSIPLLRCYDGTRGKWRSMGKLFYVYYPAHLALIGVLRILLWGAGASTAAGSF